MAKVGIKTDSKKDELKKRKLTALSKGTNKKGNTWDKLTTKEQTLLLAQYLGIVDANGVIDVSILED